MKANSEPAAFGGWGKRPAVQLGNRLRRGILLVCIFVFGIGTGLKGSSQQAPAGEAAGSSLEQMTAETGTGPLAQWSGLPVKSISFQGVALSRLVPFA